VATLDEDRILRRFLERRALQPAHQLLAGQGVISFKIDSRALDELPAPRPLVEIFVYSPRMEGIHLRGGRVARGGIRWSDRREDFRTEILCLMKPDREERGDRADRLEGRLLRRSNHRPTPRARQSRPEGIACYQTLIRGCSTSPTTYAAEAVATPAKSCGTMATIPIWWSPPTRAPPLSPTSPTRCRASTDLARTYASRRGGSAGYDHKKMGITARWAPGSRWERRLSRARQRTSESDAVHRWTGVGDMSGDVFWQRQCCSAQHDQSWSQASITRHIFIVSAPDAFDELGGAQAAVRSAALVLVDYDRR
jgi:glutamate dehydrogenase